MRFSIEGQLERADLFPEDIRLYFGESIALYFAFLGFYTKALLFPFFLGVLQLLIPTETVSFFCIFNVVWVTVFLEVSIYYPRRERRAHCSIIHRGGCWCACGDGIVCQS